MKVHVICGMCGSDKIYFKIEHCGCGDCGCSYTDGWAASTLCDNCGTLTNVMSINDQKREGEE